MSARILVIDDVAANRRLLEAKLASEYYEVLSASRGEEGMILARTEQPDVILLDVVMPGLDGFETCRRLKADPRTRHIPIVLLTALDQREDRIRGLSAGAEDFLSKPFEDYQLFARIRSLHRLKVAIDVLRAHESSSRRLGLGAEREHESSPSGRILVVDPNRRQTERVRTALATEHTVLRPGEGDDASGVDLLIISVATEGLDGLQLIARLSAGPATRRLPILAIVDPDAPEKAARALELGAQDVVSRPIDADELSARVRTLIKRKHYVEELRRALDQTLEAAVTDQLTGLFNRRYFHTQFEVLLRRNAHGGDRLCVLVCDLDHFKRINDQYGHAVGDDVLREFSVRLGAAFRPSDVVCRFGGEEFVVLMPETTIDRAMRVAERVRRSVADSAFPVGGAAVSVPVTVSIGVAESLGAHDTADKIVKRADEALYRAKETGRNCVVSQPRDLSGGSGSLPRFVQTQ